MRFRILLFILYPLSFILSAEAADCYRVHLTDKAGAEYCALSERAMLRRERQGIALDSTDVCVSPLYIQALQEQGWLIVTESRWLNTVVVQRAEGDTLGVDALMQFPFVSHIEQVSGGSDLPTYASSKFRQEWQMTDGFVPADTYRAPIRELHGEVLSASGFRGQGMLIAVLDGGFQNLNNLPFLFKKVDGWYDTYAPSDVDGTELWAADTHGTHILSIMATDSARGVWGTAPESRYFVIRTEYALTESPLEEDMWVRGAEVADSIGADLINSSLGYYAFDNNEFSHTWDDLGAGTVFVSKGAKIACQKGMLVCNSAGNERAKDWQKICFPGDVEEVFTIGGTTSSLEPGYFTSVGWTTPYVKPDVSCRGVGSWLIDYKTGKPTTGSGTSYSSPMMCGLMASLWSADPTLSPARLRQIVRESASQYTSPDSLIGYGLPDFRQALKVIRPDLDGIEQICLVPDNGSIYNLSGQSADQKGLCIRRRKIVFVR